MVYTISFFYQNFRIFRVNGERPRSTRGKTSRSRDGNFESGNRTRGHIGERRMLSPPHHPCSLKIFPWSGNRSSFIFNDVDYDDDDNDDYDDDEVKFLSE